MSNLSDELKAALKEMGLDETDFDELANFVEVVSVDEPDDENEFFELIRPTLTNFTMQLEAQPMAMDELKTNPTNAIANIFFAGAAWYRRYVYHANKETLAAIDAKLKAEAEED